MAVRPCASASRQRALRLRQRQPGPGSVRTRRSTPVRFVGDLDLFAPGSAQSRQIPVREKMYSPTSRMPNSPAQLSGKTVGFNLYCSERQLLGTTKSHHLTSMLVQEYLRHSRITTTERHMHAKARPEDVERSTWRSPLERRTSQHSWASTTNRDVQVVSVDT
jgi:hypothetical protein